MKKILIALFTIPLLLSCSETESEYNDYVLKHDMRMLDVEYEKSLINLKADAELRLLIHRTDSMLFALKDTRSNQLK